MGIFIPKEHPKTKDALGKITSVPKGSAKYVYTVRRERQGLNIM